jgi:predicted nucleic acid-binding protein
MPAMKRIMLDSNVHDLIVADKAAKAAILKRLADGLLKLVSTHVQRDELSQAPSPKRDALLAIYELNDVVQTTGAVWDVSHWDQSTYGSDEVNASIEALMAGNPNHAEDALIAATAAGQVEVLVTNETRLASKIQRAGFAVNVWSWGQFVEWLGC